MTAAIVVAALGLLAGTIGIVTCFAAMFAMVLSSGAVRTTTSQPAMHPMRTPQGLEVVSAKESLYRLLRSLFDEQEFREFLRVEKATNEVDLLIPAQAGVAAQVAIAIDALERRALIDNLFFSRLVRTRPLREAEILAVWQAYSIASAVD